MRKLTFAAAAAIAALAIAPAVASAHVTVQPSEAPAGGFVVLDVRVPNEQESGNTTKVDVQLPPGFVEASYQTVPGWTVEVKKEKLANPVQTDDGPVDEEVREIIWTAAKGQGIAPGQFQDFPISVEIPGKAGDVLTFKAIQTYDSGDAIRWIGAADSEAPAPTVHVTAAGQDHHDTTPADQQASGGSGSDDHAGGDHTRANVALGVGIAALLVGLVAIGMTMRRKPASS